MDVDPAVESELDTFSLILPLPYRVACIIVLGTWAWGLNLQYFDHLKIDVPYLIRYQSRRTTAHLSHHTSTYRLATLLTVPLVVSLLLFWALTRFEAARVVSYSFLPNIYLLLLILAFFLPLRGLSQTGRTRFLQTLRRVSIGGLAQPDNGRFGDILLADVLTSYAKVGADLFVALCMAISSRSTSSTAMPNRNCGGVFVVPFLIGVPSLIRLRQCLIEYLRVQRSLKSGEADVKNGWGGQHLGNALKYSSAFPVIILSALQRDDYLDDLSVGSTLLHHLWIAFVFINSLYSFYWDVAKDWDLTLFDALGASFRRRIHHMSANSAILLPNSPSATLSYSLPNEYPYGLRRHRYIHAPNVYYVVVGIDLVLRFTWSLKLSPHLVHFNDLEGAIFLIEVLEVFRRWVWIFLRVETEWVRTNRGPSLDDVLLGEGPSNKLDDD